MDLKTMEDAMLHFSIRQKPIRKQEDIPESWKQRVYCPPVDQKWKESIKNRPWATGYSGDNQLDGKLIQLREMLLSFAGDETVMMDCDPDIDNILAYGQLWNGWSNIRLMKGEDCHCHQNSADLYLANKDKNNLSVATGYALSDDGLWRQHSWLVLRLSRSIQIIETTKKRQLYFGVVLIGKPLEEFLYLNS